MQLYNIILLPSNVQFTLQRPQSSTWIEDHHLLQVFKISSRLSKITGLQVTNPKLKGRAHEIPNNVTLGPFKAAEPLQVKYFTCLHFKKYTYKNDRF